MNSQNPDTVIPLGDLKREYAAIGLEIDAAVRDCLTSGWFVLGERGAAFERAFAATLGGACEAIGCASGTDAIALALRALGIGPGKRVLTTPNTCAPSWMGIRMSGADIAVMDCGAESLLVDPAILDASLDAQGADAVLVVHLYGSVPPMDAIASVCASHRVALIEDCAQAHGAAWNGQPAGTLGDAAAFSFYPTKNLGAYGDGGAVVTRDAAVAERVRRLRNYGYGAERDYPLEEGVNSRLDELQAAILSAKLPHLAAWNERRREIANAYETALQGSERLRPVRPPEGCTPARHLFVVRAAQRDAFRNHMRSLGIETGIHYPHALHRTPAFDALGLGAGSFPHAEAAANEVVSIPLHPFLSDAEVERVTDALTAWYTHG